MSRVRESELSACSHRPQAKVRSLLRVAVLICDTCTQSDISGSFAGFFFFVSLPSSIQHRKLDPATGADSVFGSIFFPHFFLNQHLKLSNPQ